MLPAVPARIVIWQAAVGVAGAAVWLVVGGPRQAIAALVGGSIGAILSLYFAIKVFARGTRDPQLMLRDLFRALALKLALATVLFSLAAKFFADAFVPLITTFMAGLAVYWFALLWNTD